MFSTGGIRAGIARSWAAERSADRERACHADPAGREGSERDSRANPGGVAGVPPAEREGAPAEPPAEREGAEWEWGREWGGDADPAEAVPLDVPAAVDLCRPAPEGGDGAEP